ncbi:MAG: ROK family protein [Fretibacterium sp.]|nr:ROK family protein [Fretibacterium sp.]
MTFYIGVDIGGTNIKAGVVDGTGRIVGESSSPTGADRPQEVVLGDILQAVENAVSASGVSIRDIRAAGVGSPGAVDSETGTVLYNYNLGWRNFAIGPMMSEALEMPVRLENDANAAALGEVVAGSAKGASSAMVITLGTGIGSGFVIDGNIWTGYNSSACEFGHMVIVCGGRPCTCGRRGCFEAYASASGLIAMTKEAIAANPDSGLSRLAHREGDVVSGHTPFDAAEAGDPVARRVVDEYVGYLACGLANLINGLQPEVISIGGGIGKQGERLLAPLRRRVTEETFGERTEGEKMTRLVSCTLGYKAGLIGAAMAGASVLFRG